jgi:hypothetical protein
MCRTCSFTGACSESYDALAQCYTARPDLANNGGGAHQAFLAAVFTFIAIRAAYELFCFIAIVFSWARNSLILSCRVWIKGSIFLPLLLLRASMRAELFDGVIMADTLPSEYVWELLTSGIAVTGLILFAHTYYLLRVAQTGLTFSNWLSVVLGLVTLVRLVSQAAWSWRMLKKRALRERWYSSDFSASGADFELEDMARGGLAAGGDSGDSENAHDYVSM